MIYFDSMIDKIKGFVSISSCLLLSFKRLADMTEKAS